MPKILLGTAERSDVEYLAEVIFVGHRIAGICEETDEIKSAAYYGMASLFRLEYCAEHGLGLKEDDIGDLGTALDAAVSAIRVANNFRVVEAQTMFGARRSEYMSGFRSYTRSILDEEWNDTNPPPPVASGRAGGAREAA